MILIGTPGADTLIGGSGADTITGLGGGDALEGGGGADRFVYGPGDSTASGLDVIVDLQTGLDVIDLTAIAPDVVSIVRTDAGSLVFAAGIGAQTVIASATDVNAGDLTAGATPLNVLLVGSDQDDRLIGGAGADTLVAGRGVDTLTGGSGADTFLFPDIFSGHVDDHDLSNVRGDTITDFQIGVDIIELNFNPPAIPDPVLRFRLGSFDLSYSTHGTGLSAEGDPIFSVGVNSKVTPRDISSLVAPGIFATASAPFHISTDIAYDTLVGGNVNDTLVGSVGSQLTGGNGADVFLLSSAMQSPESAAQHITDFRSDDSVDLKALQPTHVSTFFVGSATFLFIEAEDGTIAELNVDGRVSASQIVTQFAPNDGAQHTPTGFSLFADDASQTLLGADGRDAIYGGAGDDFINGMGDGDVLYGGGGADRFYEDWSGSTPSAPDYIVDFQPGVDKIDLSALETNSANRYGMIEASGATYVFGDQGGDGTLDFLLQINATGLHASDFIGVFH